MQNIKGQSFQLDRKVFFYIRIEEINALKLNFIQMNWSLIYRSAIIPFKTNWFGDREQWGEHRLLKLMQEKDHPRKYLYIVLIKILIIFKILKIAKIECNTLSFDIQHI